MVSLDSSRKKLIAIVIIICVLVSGLLVGAASLFQKKTEEPLYKAEDKITEGEVEIVDKEAETVSYIPDEATSVYSVAPANAEEAQKWWTSIAKTAKYRLDLATDITPVANSIKQVSLVALPDDESYREEVGAIIEVKDGENVAHVRDYLANMNPEPNGSVVFQDGNIISIAPPGLMATFEEVGSGEAENILSNPVFVEDTEGAKDSIFWYDFEGFFTSITTEGVQEEYPEAINNVKHKLMGFQDNTRWLGTSDDFGQTWIGHFPSGGYDKELQDLGAYEAAAMDEFTYNEGRPNQEGEDSSEDSANPGSETALPGSEEAPAEGEDTTQNTTEEGVVPEDPGTTPEGDMEMEGGDFVSGPSMMALDAVSVRAKATLPSEERPPSAEGDEESPAPSDEGENAEEGEERPVTTGGVVDWTSPDGSAVQPDEDEALDYYDSVIMFSPVSLTNAMTSSGMYPTNIHLHTLKVKEGLMEVTTSYTSETVENELLGEEAYQVSPEEANKSALESSAGME